MKKYVNHYVFEEAKQNNKITIDENGVAKCAKCGKILESGSGAFLTFIKCVQCDESVQEVTRAQEEAKRKQEEAKRTRATNEARKACFEGERAFAQTFENDDATNGEISEKLKNRYIAKFAEFKKKGGGLLFYGGIGTGKTYLARAVLNALIDKGYKAKEIQISRVYNAVCADGERKEAFLNDICKYDIVLIDDLGVERSNEAMSEFVYSLINTLYEHKTPIVCTTNLAISHFNAPNLDTNTGRIYSRICGTCLAIEVNKANKRTNELKTLIAEWNNCTP